MFKNLLTGSPARRTGMFLFCLCLLVFLLSCSKPAAQQPQQGKGGKGGGRGGQGQQAISVTVAKAEIRDLPVYLTGLGSVTAFNTVVVKSRLDGQLVTVAFKEGQNVNKGDLLAVIDPRPYEVALSQAEATLFKDQSALKDAKLNLARFEDLFKNGGVISRQQLDTQASQVGQLEGSVRADQAQVDNARLHRTTAAAPGPSCNDAVPFRGSEHLGSA